MPDIWLYGTGWVLRGNWGTYCDRGGFLFRNSLRSSSATKSLSLSQGKLASLSQADPIPVIYISCRPLTHTQLEWLSIARHVEQQCSSGWRLRCRKMSSGKRQSRFCPCLCVSQCVCVCVWNAFCAFSISTMFSPGEKATQKAAIRLSRLPIRHDIYTYTIYSYAQYVFRYCFFVCVLRWRNVARRR